MPVSGSAVKQPVRIFGSAAASVAMTSGSMPAPDQAAAVCALRWQMSLPRPQSA